jgi:hypothetical protein
VTRVRILKGSTFDLRCEVREKLIRYLAEEVPEALPRNREVYRRDEAGYGEPDAPSRSSDTSAGRHPDRH